MTAAKQNQHYTLSAINSIITYISTDLSYTFLFHWTKGKIYIFFCLRKNYLLENLLKTATGEMAEPAINNNNIEFPCIEIFRPFAFPRKKLNHLTVTYLHLHSLVYCTPSILQLGHSSRPPSWRTEVFHQLTLF